MYTKPDKHPLSEQTGYMYPIYLTIAKTVRELNRVRKHLEKTKPWFDRIQTDKNKTKPWFDRIQTDKNKTKQLCHCE